MDQATKPTQAQTASAKGKRNREAIKVLLVEDDTFINDLVSKKLSELGYEIQSLHSGTRVVEKMLEWKPDVLLLDLLLPGVLGEEIIPILREKPETKEIPIIVFSNLSDKDHIAKILALGAQEYLIKIETDLAHFDAAILRNV